MGKLALVVGYAKGGNGLQILTPVLASALPTPDSALLLHTRSKRC